MSYQSCILPCDAIDLLVSVEIRPWSRPKGYMRGYYEAARSSKNPISYDITSDMLRLDHARVAIVTGIYSPEHFPVGEVDGPTGGAVLARALEMLGHEVHFLAEDEIKGPFEGLKHRLRLNTTFRSTSGLNREIVRQWADEYDVAVAIEKLGRAADGRRYSIQGTPMEIDGDSYIDDMFLAMNEKGKLTIGIGDGGNEIGHGRIYDTVVSLHPKGKMIATVTATKYVYPVSVSNFGAYALCAALALQTRRPELMVDGATVRTLITTVTTLGQLDGSTVDSHYVGDDGVPIDAVSRVVDLLGDIVAHWGRTIVRSF